MTLTLEEANELAYDLAAAAALEPAPESLATLAQKIAFHRADVERRARAEFSGELLGAVLSHIPHEVGYVYTRGQGSRVAKLAMVDLDATDYFGNPLSKADLARRKREATTAAKRLVRELLAEPVDPADVEVFQEGIANEVESRAEGFSDVSPAVYAEVDRISAAWQVLPS